MRMRRKLLRRMTTLRTVSPDRFFPIFFIIITAFSFSFLCILVYSSSFAYIKWGFLFNCSLVGRIQK